MKKKSSFRRIFRPALLLICLLTIIYSGLQIMESTVLHKADEQPAAVHTKTIVRDGIEYFPKQDVTVVMVLGIDQLGPVKSSNYYRNNGAADSVMLLVFDESSKECSVLYLNRDTMLDMNVLGVGGKYAGTTYGQLALAHTYGNGLEESCVNVKNTLENFIHGLTVDYYVAMNMDAIPMLNDAVGGVTVNVTDDFSKVNPSITMGELTLKGDQVIDYVRTRKDVGDQKNVTRMSRQREYVDGFMKALMEKGHGDAEFLIKLYENVAPYMVTDCSVETLSGMLSRYSDFKLKELVTPEGNNVIGEEYYEFYVDEQKLDELIVKLFYSEK